jgi:trehalose-6-phosphatase
MLTIGVDFDGTLTKKAQYPSFGENVPGAVEALRILKDRGYKIILWTCRNGEALDMALEWFKFHRIELDGINSNCHTDKINLSVKIVADYYIDDRALGCPTTPEGYVDWHKVLYMLGEIDFQRI